jgi:hypothetical protein
MAHKFGANMFLTTTVAAQIGVEALVHVHDLEMQDLEEVGMARPERKRFMRALSELGAATGMHNHDHDHAAHSSTSSSALELSARHADIHDEGGRLMEKALSAPRGGGASASRRKRDAHVAKRNYGEDKRERHDHDLCIRDDFSKIDTSFPVQLNEDERERERLYLEDCDMTSLSGRPLTFSSASSQTGSPRCGSQANTNTSTSGSCSSRSEDLGSARSGEGEGEGESSCATILSQACTATPPSATPRKLRLKPKPKAGSTLMDCSKLLARARSICTISVPGMHGDKNGRNACGFLVAFEPYGITAVVTSCEVLRCQKDADQARLYFNLSEDVNDKDGKRIELRLETSLLWWHDEALGVCAAACRGRTQIGVEAVPALLGASQQGSPENDVLVLHADSKRKLTCHRITKTSPDGEFQFPAGSCRPEAGCPVSTCPVTPCTVYFVVTNA